MQPIETIPRDGSEVVGYQANAPAYQVMWMGNDRWMITSGGGRLVMFSDEEMRRFVGWEPVADFLAREREKDLDKPLRAQGHAPRILGQMGIRTNRQLIEWADEHEVDELYAVKGVGPKTITQVEIALWDARAFDD